MINTLDYTNGGNWNSIYSEQNTDSSIAFAQNIREESKKQEDIMHYEKNVFG